MTEVELLAYADRLGGDIRKLQAVLDGPLRAFGSVHVLPFYVPFDGSDAGFDPVDHASVDPRLGTWDDMKSLAGTREITADLIVNHASCFSKEFVDWLEKGDASEYAGMFLTFDTVFPNGGTEAEITAFYRPRPGLPFTPYQGADGSRHLVWTTFMPTQVDLDVKHPAAVTYLQRVMRALVGAGVSTLRLDAVGYAIKTPGSDSFMTEETLEFARDIVRVAHDEGLQVLVEVHAHYSQQLAIAPIADWVYDFALAPLLLHSLGTGTIDRLTQWLEIRPENAITVLDTHDGIGIIDAGPIGDKPGLISQDEMAAIFKRAEEATNGHSAIASVVPAWFTLPHQINATFYSVLGAQEVPYLLARAVQHFLPGRPQVYYVGLLGGLDDTELFARTQNGRDVNRHTYSEEELAAALETDITRAQLGLVRMRSSHRAFDGEFSWSVVAPMGLEFRWENGDARAVLTVWTTLGSPSFEIALMDDGRTQVLDTVASVANWDSGSQ